ncbi:MAG: hypothetical protein WBN04_11615 [Paracoccaceae bacterium]
MEKPKAVPKAPADNTKQTHEMLAAMATVRFRAQYLPEPQAALLKVETEPSLDGLKRCHRETETGAARGVIPAWVSNSALKRRAIGAWQTPSSKRRAEYLRDWIHLCAHCADSALKDDSKASKETPDKPATNSTSSNKVRRAPLH